MARFRARLQSYSSGSEGVYDFDEQANLMSRPADEVVEAFIAFANREIFDTEPVRYELNGVMRHDGKDVVVGMGKLAREGDPPGGGDAFTIIINPAGMG
jgi:hypothetical protein